MIHWCKVGDEVAIHQKTETGFIYGIGIVSKITKTGLIKLKKYDMTFYPSGESKDERFPPGHLFINEMTEEHREKVRIQNRLHSIRDILMYGGNQISYEDTWYDWYSVSDEKVLQIAEILGI